MGRRPAKRRRLSRREPQARHARRAFELLETRQLLTANLYLDFGDNFPAGGLDMTVLELRDTLGAGGIQGPDLRTLGTPAMTDATPLSFTGLSGLVTAGPTAFDYNGDAVINATDYTDLRTAVVSLVQRYYSPFDLNVVIAPALDNTSDATYISDINARLQMGANVDGERDTWLFVTSIVRTDTAASVGQDIGTFGISSGADLGGDNDAEETALVFAEMILRTGGGLNNAVADTALARVSSHEAGHTFGLVHTESQPASSAADLLSTADVMRTGDNQTALENFGIVTRFPLAVDVPPPNEVVNYDRLSDSDLLGLRVGEPAYVTGTGANDVITITRTGPNLAQVTVTPFTNPDFTGQIDVPGQAAGTPYLYVINTSNGILIDGSVGLDRFEIDATLGVTVTVRGSGGVADQLVFAGDGTQVGSYTPGAASAVGLDGKTYFGGQLVAGTTTVNLQEFTVGATSSLVTVDNFPTYTLTTPNGADSLDIDLNSFDTDQHRIKGTSGTVDLVPLALHDVQNFVVAAGTNDAALSQNDAILVSSNGMAVADLLSLAVNTGDGDDTLTVDFSTGLVRLFMLYDAGASVDDNDRLVLTGDPATAITRETYRVGATEDAGSWVVDPDGNLGPGANGVANGDELIVSFVNLEPVDTDLPATTFDVLMNASNNQATVVDGGLLNGFNSLQATDLNATFETFRFARKVTTRIMGQSGIDTISVDYTIPAASLAFLRIYGHIAAGVMGQPADDGAADVLSVLRNAVGVTHTLFGQNGDDSFTVGNGDLSLILAAVTISAGSGTDSLVVNDSVRATVVDYHIDPTRISICINPGPPPVRNDIALIDGALEFARLDATNGVNRFDVTPATATVFTIDGNLPPPGTPIGDLLSVRFAGTTGKMLTYDAVTGNGKWEFDNPHLDINFENIETLNNFGVLAYGADAGDKSKPRVKIVNAETGALITSFLAYESSYRGGVRVAVADVTGDGRPEIITAPGKNHAPLIKIFDLLTGTAISGMSFHAFSKSFTGGVNLAVGDLDDDGFNDIAVAPHSGKTEIRTFINTIDASPTKPFSGNAYNRFLAFDSGFIGGATIAVGDVRLDGKAEIIVGAGAGMRAEVRIFDGLTVGPTTSPAAFARRFTPFDAKQRGGVWVAAANIDGGSKFELLVGAGVGSKSQVATFDLSNLKTPAATFTPFSGPGSNAPVRVAAADTGFDGISELFVAQGPDGESQQIRSGPANGPLVDFLMAEETDLEYLNGFFIAADVQAEMFMC
jgi:hypothetical protein